MRNMTFRLYLVLVCLIALAGAENAICPLPVRFASASMSNNDAIEFDELVLKSVGNSLKHESYVQVMSLVGTAKVGKSTTLDMAAEHMVRPEIWKHCNSMFNVGNNIMSTFTKGMWMWAFTSEMTISEKALILLDTQGLQDEVSGETSLTGITRMTIFAMIAPDLSVFMVEKAFNSVDLGYMALGARFSKWIDMGTNADADSIAAPTVRLPYLVVLLDSDVNWARDKLRLPTHIDTRTDVDDFERNLNDGSEASATVRLLYADRMLLALPRANSSKTLEYRENILKKRHLLPEIDQGYRRHRDTVMRTLQEKLMQQAARPRFAANSVFGSNGFSLFAWWRLVADAINKEPMEVSGAVRQMMDHLTREAESAAVDDIKRRRDALASDEMLWPRNPTEVHCLVEKDVCMAAASNPATTAVVPEACIGLTRLRRLEADPEMDQTELLEVRKRLAVYVAEALSFLKAHNDERVASALNEAFMQAKERVAHLQQKLLFPASPKPLADLIASMNACPGCYTPLQAVSSCADTALLAAKHAEVTKIIDDAVDAIKSQNENRARNGYDNPSAASSSSLNLFITRGGEDGSGRFIVGPELTITAAMMDPLNPMLLAARKLTITASVLHVPKGLYLVADELVLPAGGCTIVSTGKNGESLGNSQAAEGAVALNGGDGTPAGDVTVIATRVSGGSLRIDSLGGAGGSGQKGCRGKKGEPADAECGTGGPGGRGGDAGASGNGARGGNVVVLLPEGAKSTVSTDGGLGGAGSAGGSGGPGGGKGSIAYTTCCGSSHWLTGHQNCWSCQRCDGKAGPAGDEGSPSLPGRKGDAGTSTRLQWGSDAAVQQSMLQQYFPPALLLSCLEYGSWLFLNSRHAAALDYLSWVYVVSSGVGGQGQLTSSSAALVSAGSYLESSRVLLHRLVNGQDYFGNPPGFVPMVSQGSVEGYLLRLEGVAKEIEKHALELAESKSDLVKQGQAADRLALAMESRKHAYLAELQEREKAQHALDEQIKQANLACLSAETQLAHQLGVESQARADEKARQHNAQNKFSLSSVMKLLPSVISVASMGPAGLLGSLASGGEEILGSVKDTVGGLFKDRLSSLGAVGKGLTQSLTDTAGLFTDPSGSFGQQKGRTATVIKSWKDVAKNVQDLKNPTVAELKALDKFVHTPLDKLGKASRNALIKASPSDYAAMTEQLGDSSAATSVKLAWQQRNQLVMQYIANAEAESNCRSQIAVAESTRNQALQLRSKSYNEKLFAKAELALQVLTQVKNDYVYSMYLRAKAYEYEVLPILSRSDLTLSLHDISSIQALQHARVTFDRNLEIKRQEIGRGPQPLRCTDNRMIVFDSKSDVVNMLNDSPLETDVDMTLLPSHPAFHRMANVKVQSAKIVLGLARRQVCDIGASDAASGSSCSAQQRQQHQASASSASSTTVSIELTHPGNPAQVMSRSGDLLVFSHQTRNGLLTVSGVLLDKEAEAGDTMRTLHEALLGALSNPLGSKENSHDAAAKDEYLKLSPFTVWKVKLTQVPAGFRDKYVINSVAMCFDEGTFFINEAAAQKELDKDVMWGRYSEKCVAKCI